jgi:S1-C subfamily serine protease
MQDGSTVRNPRYEIRLLTITIVVSALMLFLLARLRFPDAQEHAAEPAPAAPPLQRLAARATYDELTSILAGVERQVAPAVVVVHTIAADPAAPEPDAESLVPAVRIDAAQAVALIGPGRRLAASTGAIGRAIAVNEPRGIALVDAGAGTVDADAMGIAPPDSVGAGPGYVAGVEASRGGPVIRPMYYGRVERGPDPRWGGDVLRFNGLQQMLPAGAAVFTLQGAFDGLGLPDGREFVVIPAAALQDEAARLARDGSIAASDLGVAVQRLDGALRAAAGVSSGVIVTDVAPGGPAAGRILAGDVITGIDGISIATPADYAGALGRLVPGTTAQVQLVRHGDAMTVPTTPSPRVAGEVPSGELGLELRTVRGVGADVVSVAPRSEAARAGILRGDVIESFGAVEAPSAQAVLRAYREAGPGSYLLVRIRRGTGHVYAGLARP